MFQALLLIAAAVFASESNDVNNNSNRFLSWIETISPGETAEYNFDSLVDDGAGILRISKLFGADVELIVYDAEGRVVERRSGMLAQLILDRTKLPGGVKVAVVNHGEVTTFVTTFVELLRGVDSAA